LTLRRASGGDENKAWTGWGSDSVFPFLTSAVGGCAVLSTEEEFDFDLIP